MPNKNSTTTPDLRPSSLNTVAKHLSNEAAVSIFEDHNRTQIELAQIESRERLISSSIKWTGLTVFVIAVGVLGVKPELINAIASLASTLFNNSG